eukprot:gene9946-10996_t
MKSFRENKFSLLLVYALGLCVMCGRQSGRWNVANKTRRRAKTGSKSGVTKSVSSLFNAMLGMSTTGGGFSRNHASSRSGSRAKEISSADDISNNRIGLAAPSLVANNSVVPYYHLPN